MSHQESARFRAEDLVGYLEALGDVIAVPGGNQLEHPNCLGTLGVLQIEICREPARVS